MPRHGHLLSALTLLLTPFILIPQAGPAQAALEGPPQHSAHVEARLVTEFDAAAPGARITVGLAKRIAPGWHTYWHNPGDSGLATTVEWQLPEGARADALQWPIPTHQPFGPITNYGYEGEVTLLAEIDLPHDARPGETVSIGALADWLVCKDVCIPEQLTLALALPIADHSVVAPHAAIAAARAQLPEALPWPARHARIDGALLLEIDHATPALDGAAWWFYPLEWGHIDHSAAQPVHITESGLRLTLTPGPAPGSAEAALAGVLVLTEHGPAGPLRRGFSLTAPAAAADGLAPLRPVVPPAGDIGTATALLFALVGGLILNLMPCVFPVLAMKVMALLRHGQAGPKAARLHGIAYLAGVLACFAALAAVVLAVQAGGSRLGWGFQFQSPLFVLLMAWLLFGVGLNLSGAFTLGGGLAGIGNGLAAREGYRGSFFTGALAAVVATPCTAPFMGVAIGFAMTQSPPVLVGIFLALGAGLALPFVLLGFFPALLTRLPRPGAWMERFKQALAFPMYAASAWLVWVLVLQSGPDSVPLALGGMIALALAAWLHDASWRAGERARRRARAGALGLVTLTLAAALTMRPSANPAPVADRAGATLSHQAYSASSLDALREEGRPVFVNFTAAWCITCLVNERVALARDEVAAAFSAHGITYLKGDWTNQNAEIGAVLAQFGRSGVPLYLYYPPGPTSTPAVLPQILTVDIVLNAIAKPPLQGAPP